MGALNFLNHNALLSLYRRANHDADIPVNLPQLHLRDLFWLVLLAALGIGWWCDRQSLQAENDRGQERLFAWPTQSGQVMEATMREDGSTEIKLHSGTKTIVHTVK